MSIPGPISTFGGFLGSGVASGSQALCRDWSQRSRACLRVGALRGIDPGRVPDPEIFLEP